MVSCSPGAYSGQQLLNLLSVKPRPDQYVAEFRECVGIDSIILQRVP